MSGETKRRFAFLVSALLLALVVGAGTPGASSAQDNASVAVNLRDGASLFRFAFKIARVNQDVVDESNAAVAFASCEACETVAVAIQIVLVFSDPAIVTPTNLALALNYECTACQTLASAYQFVLTTGGPVHFTAEGNRRIAEIRRAVLELLRSDAPLADVQAELDALADELRAVLGAEIVAARNAAEAGGRDEAVTEAPPETGATETGEPTDAPVPETTATETATTETTQTDTVSTTTTP